MSELWKGTPPESIDVAVLPYDPEVRPGPFRELRDLDLLEMYEEAIGELAQYRPTRFWASHATRCPRAVWFAWRGIRAEDTLTSYVRREIGYHFELIEDALRGLVLDKLNTKTISQVLGKYPRLQRAVDGALRAQKITEVDGGYLVSRRFTTANVGDYAITQLPFLLDVGLKYPISCVVDAVVLMKDLPVIYEIKSTKGRGARRLKAKARSPGERIVYPGWVVQIALYTVGLGLPAKLRIWARDDTWRTEFDLDWRGGYFCINGYPYTIGGTDPVAWAIKRFEFLERFLEEDHPPGKIVELEDGGFALELPRGFPTYEGESYVLGLDSKGNVDYRKSAWCYDCGYRRECHRA